MKFKLNLKKFFTKEAKTLTTTYKRLMSVGRGIRNDDAPSKKKPNDKPWLIDTGVLKSKGFVQEATKLSMKVRGSRRIHPNSTVTYEQLFDFHNQKGYSGIFGTMFPHNSKIPERLADEIDKQIEKWIKKNIPTKIKVH